ncbi:MAG: UvrD-helicase domain-containing protein [Bacteroidota bacterium]|nr:UvrD-helicase domain-containing protein [Bacteroidota bacterium]
MNKNFLTFHIAMGKRSPNIRQFPNFTLVSASAGSGKTTSLTLRFLQLLLSDKIPNNNLRNILAITFTNNASIEMKERVLEYLKKASFADAETLKQMGDIIGLECETLINRSREKVDHILDNYSDFQVQTIDSFLSRIMKISALEFGLPPSFDVILNSDLILDEAFEHLAQELGYDSNKRKIFRQIIEIVNQGQGKDQKFLWNPNEKLLKGVKNIYNRLSSHAGQSISKRQDGLLEDFRNKILKEVVRIGDSIEKSGFNIAVRYQEIVNFARGGNFNSLIGRTLDQKALLNSKEKSFPAFQKKIEEMQSELLKIVGEYYLTMSLQYYQPFVEVNQYLHSIIEKVRKQRGEVALSEATKMLAAKIFEMNIPEIYFSLGEQIYHFLIDEFQDTSPIQWATLRPLIEESLGKAGSLFLVGDTKQAIFTFRGGDWQIMARMKEKEEFPSVECNRIDLETNYRSSEAVVEFAKKVFHEIIPHHIEKEIADLSGLVSYEQKVEDKKEGKGFVEVKIFNKPEEKTEYPPERKAVIEIIRDCQSRGYKLGDIAIIAPRNQDVIVVSGWLNAEGIKFLSHSSLDIRKRKIAAEILSLLKFLDSPIDDLSFASFLLSDIFSTKLKNEKLSFDAHSFLFDWRINKWNRKALYSYFREIYPHLWEQNFEHLFNVVGYLPLYDLIAEFYKLFNLYEYFADEAAVLIKLLETINTFEEKGSLSLKDFLAFADDESEEESWNIAVSPSENAITVMTIHKAKGLGYPIVITLFYDAKPHSDSMVVVENENGIQLMHITKKEAEYHPELLKRFERKEILRQVDELNKLYVALTRAKQEMYVISIAKEVTKNGKQGEPSKYFPQNGFTIGKRTHAEKGKESEEKEARIIFPKTRGISQAIAHTKIALKETKRGDFIHAVLAQILYFSDSSEKQIDEAIDKIKFKYHDDINVDEVSVIIYNFITNKDVIEYFSPLPDRKVLTEQEIVNRLGVLFRVDRIIIDTEKVTVIDFKTGTESDDHPKQVREYMKILTAKFPGSKIHGLLAYIDLGIIREVK